MQGVPGTPTARWEDLNAKYLPPPTPSPRLKMYARIEAAGYGTVLHNYGLPSAPPSRGGLGPSAQNNWVGSPGDSHMHPQGAFGGRAETPTSGTGSVEYAYGQNDTRNHAGRLATSSSPAGLYNLQNGEDYVQEQNDIYSTMPMYPPEMEGAPRPHTAPDIGRFSGHWEFGSPPASRGRCAPLWLFNLLYIKFIPPGTENLPSP